MTTAIADLLAYLEEKNRMFTATLRCGAVLSYEARSFVPDPGQRVPCRRHGYCDVKATDGGAGPCYRGHFAKRAAPRAQSELTEWLHDRPETTVHALRRKGFTLRMVAAAEKDGLVDLDLRAGRVAVRAGPSTSA